MRCLKLFCDEQENELDLTYVLSTYRNELLVRKIIKLVKITTLTLCLQQKKLLALPLLGHAKVSQQTVTSTHRFIRLTQNLI